jgi:5-(carboxyamino)imidazole ribonucleotide mutase
MTTPKVGLIMGSQSDWPTLRAAAAVLDALEIPCESRIVSAHRTPERMRDYARNAAGRGLKVIIAAAGGAAHLPGMTASMTTLPVLGVPVESKALKGMDSLLSIVQMPGGVPVATFAIGDAGAKNAALHAAAILALSDEALAKRLTAWSEKLTHDVAEIPSDHCARRSVFGLPRHREERSAFWAVDSSAACWRWPPRGWGSRRISIRRRTRMRRPSRSAMPKPRPRSTTGAR